MDELEAHLDSQRMYINLGPCHPAMHGTVRMRVELEGETIARADPEIGFLHRGFEKSCENVTWTQCLPYTDRLNYVSAITCNLGFLNAVEKLIGITIPERAQYIRVIAGELHRIADHLTWWARWAWSSAASRPSCSASRPASWCGIASPS